MSEVVGTANLCPNRANSIFKSRPGSREVMCREEPNMKVTDSSIPSPALHHKGPGFTADPREWCTHRQVVVAT